MESSSIGNERLRIFDIEYFGTKDGPGIRTVVFLKGCPLRCEWCQNPESQKSEPEVMYYRDSCVLCGQCLIHCPQQAIIHDVERGFVTDEQICLHCGTCANTCIYHARTIVGEWVTSMELEEAILKDSAFFAASGGGVTFSGGEPCSQYKGLKPLIDRLHVQGIHVAVETSGYCDGMLIRELVDQCDLLFIDLKHVDDALHRKHIGIGTELILNNIRHLVQTHPEKIVVRIPVIPGFNSTADACRSILGYLSSISCASPIEILPYHNLGEAKYAALGRPYSLMKVRPLEKDDLAIWAEIGKALDLHIVMGTR